MIEWLIPLAGRIGETLNTDVIRSLSQIKKTIKTTQKVQKVAADRKDKVANEGNIAEAVLGAAMVAKIAERKSNGSIGKIGAAQVQTVIRLMQRATPLKGSTQRQFVKVDVGGTARDRITFNLNLGSIMMAEFRKAESTSLARLAQGAASYVNTPRMESLAQVLYSNNVNNKIAIDVDGLSANTATKTDVMLTVDKYVFDKISLKAGSMKTGHTLGQVGGNTWASLLRLFHEGYNDRSKKKEVGLMLDEFCNKTNEQQYMKLIGTKPSFDSVARGVQFAYKKASEVFNRLSQPKMASNVYKFLQFHSARGDSDVKIVKLHLGKHKTMNPLRLEQSLKDMGTIRAVTRLDTKWPIILVYDTAAGPTPTTIYNQNVIFSITVKIDSRQIGYIYHLVKEGARLAALMEEEDA